MSKTRALIESWRDNPVSLLMFRQKRRKGDPVFASSWTPLIFAILFLGILYVSDSLTFTLLPMGLLLYLCLACFFGLHCLGVVLRSNTMDPLALSVRNQVADQFVLTGVTPLRWLQGKSIIVFETLIRITGLYLPWFVVAWILGNVKFYHIVVFVLAVWIFCISFYLGELLSKRISLVGMATLLMVIGLVVVSPLSLFLYLPGIGPGTPEIMTPLLSLNPASVLLWTVFQSESMDFLNGIFSDSAWFSAWGLTEKYFIPLFYVIGHLFFWAYAVLGITVGTSRCQFDPGQINGKLKKPKKQAPHVRSLGFFQTFRLFHENSNPRNPNLWETIFLTLNTLGIGFILLACTQTIAVSPIREDLRQQGLLILFLVVLLFSATTLCFSRARLRRETAGTSWGLLTPNYAFWGVRVFAIIAVCVGTAHFIFPGLQHPGWEVGVFLSSITAVTLASAVWASLTSWTYATALQKLGVLFSVWLFVPWGIVWLICALFPVPAVTPVLGNLSPLYTAVFKVVPSALPRLSVYEETELLATGDLSVLTVAAFTIILLCLIGIWNHEAKPEAKSRTQSNE